MLPIMLKMIGSHAGNDGPVIASESCTEQRTYNLSRKYMYFLSHIVMLAASDDQPNTRSVY